MKIKANNGNFEPCPEFTGKAVCVDVTPLRKQQSQFGERDVFKLVFEVDMEKEDGGRFCVWSRNFTPSLNEKANFRKFLRGWFGRDLSKQELDDFETDSLVGKSAQLVVVQEHKDNETYANIVACTAGQERRAAESLRQVHPRQGPDAGQWRAPGNGALAAARAARAVIGGHSRLEPNGEDLGGTKIHVGRCKGLEVRDLSPEAGPGAD